MKFAIYCAVLSTTLAFNPAKAAKAPLGFWQCSLAKKRVYLALMPHGVLSFQGAGARYKVEGSALKVQQQGQWVRYPFNVKGKSLSVTMPTKQRMRCKPVSTRGVSALKGMLCSWSGSSSSYGGTSISRSTRVHFDGEGNLSYRSEGSFSGPSGLVHNRSKTHRGMYRVVGKLVLVVFPDGDGGAARVHLRQRSGRITELKYEGTLFAAGLCK